MKFAHALAGALLCTCLSFAAPAHAQSALEFAASGMGARVETAQVVVPVRKKARETWPSRRGSVQTMIAEHVSARIGSQWVGTALLLRTN